MSRQGERTGRAGCILWLLVLAGCAIPSFDMSTGQIEPAGPGWGVVMGSVLVQAEEDPPDSWFNRLFGRTAAGFTYEFQIVRVELTDPQATAHPYAARYRLEVKPKVERIFVARLPVGDYLIKAFRHEGFSAIGGDLDVSFSVLAESTQYLGRLLLDVPRRVSFGTPYTYKVEDARDATLAAVQKEHPGLDRDVVNRPMQLR